MGTAVRVTNPASGASTRCRIESRGPSDQRRVIDLAKDTFARVADPSRGIVEVRLDW
jgi:rare lipoprotein A (peptidoglycan hydrolase)